MLKKWKSESYEILKKRVKMEEIELKRGNYMELSEKERFLRELVESAQLIAQKRDIVNKNDSELNVQKGGLRELEIIK